MTKKDNSHAKVRKKLLDEFDSKDMLTGEFIHDIKKCSYHHIEKKEHGGPYSVDNGAIFLKLTHMFLHNQIETKNKQLYILIKQCLLLYKFCKENGYDELCSQYETEVQPIAKKIIKNFYKNKK